MSTNHHDGVFNVVEPAPRIAGRHVTIGFEYTVGEAGLSEGGQLRIGLPNTAWAKPEVPQYYFWSEYARGERRRYTDYDRVNTTVRFATRTKAVPLLETDTRFRKPWSYPPSWLRDFDRYWIWVTAEDGGLLPGDRIIVTYGDPQWMPLTARVQRFTESKLCYLAFVDVDGSRSFQEVRGSPCFTSVSSGPVSRMTVTAPSIVDDTSIPAINVVYTDEQLLVPNEEPVVERLEVACPADGAPRSVELTNGGSANRIRWADVSASQVRDVPVRIRVRDPQRGLMEVSNPVLVRPAGSKLYWGDLHAQSQYHGWNPDEEVGISCHTPLECYRYARDYACLDFCAITDSGSITKDIWGDSVEAAQQMTEPARFVAFQGTELGDNVHGHRNVLFADDTDVAGIPVDSGDPEAPDRPVGLTTPEIQERFAGCDNVLLVPHHTKMWNDWKHHHPQLERVMEIYSVWGSGERRGTDLWEVLAEMTGGAQEAWARGYRLGVIAGSDTHTGLPGRSLPNSDRSDFHIYKAGIAGVWATELSRKGIFDALRMRRCFGTTGVRMILETFLDGHPMGSEVILGSAGKSRQCEVNVCGTSDLDSVTIVKNNADVQTFTDLADHAHLEWSDKSEVLSGDYYYVRVIQRDGNRAWFSPIWVDVE